MQIEDFTLRYEADPILRQKLNDFDFSCGLDPKLIESKMIDLMAQHRGIGIAANQVGFDKRVIVVALPESIPVAMFNPVIKEYSTQKHTKEEGCLSFPNLYIDIVRPSKITLEYVDTGEKQCIIELNGQAARCVQHEIDHLNGVCFTDKVSSLRLLLAKKLQRK